jgi:DNA-binding response OmpR family regulator
MTEAGGARRIVVIEDDLDIAALIRETLRDAGHEVVVHTELDGAADPEIALVVTDLMLERGYDQAAARAWISTVRTHFPGASVVVSTAHAPAAAGGASSIGADAVVTKPFDIGQLAETVESLLHR